MRKLQTLNKATRAEAYEFAQTIHDGHELTTYERDLLLNYFAPALPQIAKDAFEWVALACSKKDLRPLMHVVHVVHVVHGTMTATDGKRIHWAPTDLPDGQYDPATGAQLATPVPDVPDIDRVKGKLRVGEKIDLQRLDVGHGSPPLATVSTGFTVNTHFLLQAINQKQLMGSAYLTDGMKLTGRSEFGLYSTIAVRMPKR